MKRTHKILIGIGSGILLLFMILGMAMEFGLMPDTKTLKGKEIKPGVIESISRHAELQPTEKVEYFYCADLFSHDAEGNVITNQRIISYEKNTSGKVEVYAATWEEIDQVKVREKGDILNDTILEVHTAKGDIFLLFLSTEEGRDQEALQYIRASLRS